MVCTQSSNPLLLYVDYLSVFAVSKELIRVIIILSHGIRVLLLSKPVRNELAISAYQW